MGLSFHWIYLYHSIFYKQKFLSSTFSLSLYYFSFIAPTLFMNGLNWRYERLGMMMLIPYILAFGSILNRSILYDVFDYSLCSIIIFNNIYGNVCFFRIKINP